MKKILIVEDSLILNDLLSLYLDGFEVISAQDSSTAIAQFKSDSPDLVLLDIILLPESKMEGINVLKQILQINPNAIVIVLSAISDSKTIEEYISIGAKEYIVKPVDKQQLLSAVHKYI